MVTMMSTLELPQRLHLPWCIRKIWAVNNSSALISSVTSPMVFDGCFELIVCRNNGFSMVFDDKTLSYNSGVYLGGQITRPMSLALKPKTELLFLKLEHGCINSVSGENMAQCNNQSIDLYAINSGLQRLLSPLLESNDMQRIIEQLNVFFKKNLNKSQQFSSVACQLLAYKQGYAENKHFLQQEFGLSTRGFEGRFKRATGLNPKKFSSLSRLRQITEALQFMEQEMSLTELALEKGYYDQAHFNRAMSDFIGSAPGKINFEQIFVPWSQDKVRFFTI